MPGRAAFAAAADGEGGAHDSVAIMEDAFDPCSAFLWSDDQTSAG